MPNQFQITRCADLQYLRDFRDLIDNACATNAAVSEEIRYDLKLAVDEACTNIILHGYTGLDPGSIILNLNVNAEKIQVTITDYGHPFEMIEVASPDPDSLNEQGLDELGLFFIHQVTDAMEYETAPFGNRLKLVKNLKKRELS